MIEKSGGGEDQPVGLAVLFDLPLDAVATNFAARVRPAPNVEPRYLLYVLAAVYYTRVNERSIKQTTGIQNLDTTSFFSEPWATPKVEKQRAIADFLDRGTSRIDELLRLRTMLAHRIRERLMSQLSALVTGTLTRTSMMSTEIPGIPKCPGHWDVVPLRRLPCEVQTGPFGSQLHANDYVSDGFPVVNPANIVDGQILADASVTVDESTRNRLGRHILQPGDVVFGRRGQLGRAGLVTDKEAGWVCGTGCLRVRFLKPTFHPDYLRHFLRLPVIAQYFESIAVGTTMENLNTESLLGMPLLVPPIADQAAIAKEANERAKRTRRLVDRIEAQRHLLTERRQALITAAVTGQLDVAKAT